VGRKLPFGLKPVSGSAAFFHTQEEVICTAEWS
jgi:hypothetical protein